MITKDPVNLAQAHGTQAIGAAQTDIAFTVVASGGTGLLNITAANHNMKKGTMFYINGGAYAGYYRVKKVISSSVIQVEGTFGSTATGTLLRKAAIDGFGFYADTVPLTIAELVPTSPTFDVTAFIATPFVAGRFYACDFKKLRITAGDATVIRKPSPAQLAYTNR
ncbi:MAG: hypothetical protein QM762_12640 [Chryseolinea sp.]